MKSVKKFNSENLRRRISLVLVAAVSLMSFNWLASYAAASGDFSSAKLTLSDPRPSSGIAQNVNYAFTWKTATAATIKCITYDFWTTQAGSTEPTGMVTNGTTKGTFSGTGITDGSWSIPGSPVEGTIKATNTTGDTVAAGVQVTTPFVVPRNPSTTGFFYIRVQNYTDDTCSTLNDKLTIAATTVQGVYVEATVDSTLSFTVAGVAASTTYKGVLSTADRCQDSATAVTFGTSSLRLSSDTDYDCAQSLTTSTNSHDGYQVTLTGRQTGGDFMKMTSDATKSITNVSGSNASPAASTAGSTEQFGYTTNDSSLSGTATRFTTSDNLFAALTTSPDEVAYNGAAISGDSVNVGLRLRFTGVTEAGVYANTLTYTCTPTF